MTLADRIEYVEKLQREHGASTRKYQEDGAAHEARCSAIYRGIEVIMVWHNCHLMAMLFTAFRDEASKNP